MIIVVILFLKKEKTFFSESLKYYRDNSGFIYKKSGENPQTIYLDCLNAPNCLAGGRFTKETGVFVQLATHSDEKPSENIVLKIQFEANLKNEVRKVENAEISVLNLYKRAIVMSEGIWLPINHKSIFLEKLRRIRKYEKEKAKKENIQSKNGSKLKSVTADAATSPMSFATITPMEATTAHQKGIATRAVTARKSTQCNTISPKDPEVTELLSKTSSAKTPVAQSQIQLRPRKTPQTVMKSLTKSACVKESEINVRILRSSKKIDHLNTLDAKTVRFFWII